jgi:xanthine dehydrogenase accessory factor
MKHWKETAQIVDRVVALAAAGRRAALATAVRISGSSYRRPGAKFLIEDDGATLGGVSGGCLEADVRAIASSVIRTGSPRLLHYETGSDDRTVWGLGLGCNGSVDIFVQAATEPPAIEILRASHPPLKDNAGPLAIATVVDGPDGVGQSMLVDAQGSTTGSTGIPRLDSRLADLASRGVIEGRSRLREIDGLVLFIDVLTVPPSLIVCGAGDDARPLVAYASDVGFAVTVVDHRDGYLSPARFPGARALQRLRPGDDITSLAVGPETLVVVKTHSLSHDREWVRAFLQAGAAYIGLLGPRARKAEIVEQIGDGAGRIFGPIGLDIGADGPEEIAISIIAELLAVRSGRQGSHLREKRETIHAG